jgi:hypothetical protein
MDWRANSMIKPLNLEPGHQVLLARRAFCAGTTATVAAGIALGPVAALAQAPGPVLDPPRIVGPIPVTATSVPHASALRPGSPSAALMQEFDYVEEEYFLFGYANVYGPGVKLDTVIGATGSSTLAIQNAKPLAAVVEAKLPYATRLLMVRPRDLAKFSGRVHAYPFHTMTSSLSVERNLLRQGDAVLGFEICTGARQGPLEKPTGGMQQLYAFNMDRYRDLRLTDASPLAWPDLKPGVLGASSVGRSPGKISSASIIYNQELFRSIAQGPDIVSQVAHALKNNHPSFPFKGLVKRVFSFGASGGSAIQMAYIDYHHDNAMMADGRPPIDGYLISVGMMPETRPKGAVLVALDSEAEIIKNNGMGRPDPVDTDQPPFRFYPIPGTGHVISAPLAAKGQATSFNREGLEASNAAAEGDLVPYDKFNTPIVWGLWHNMYAWIEKGVPMPRAPRVQRDPNAADGVARDAHGNALGGLRLPWLEVPDATYVHQISASNPLRAGMRPFDEAKFRQLHGSRAKYLKKVNAAIDRLAADRWIMPEDAGLMHLEQ